VDPRRVLSRIERVNQELQTALNSGQINALNIAIGNARRPAGTSWPNGPPLKEDDPLLLAAIAVCVCVCVCVMCVCTFMCVQLCCCVLFVFVVVFQRGRLK